MFQHSCIKCSTPYQDKEEEPYLCDTCKRDRKTVADEIDKKYKTTNQVPNSPLTQFYDNAQTKNKPDGSQIFLTKVKL